MYIAAIRFSFLQSPPFFCFFALVFIPYHACFYVTLISCFFNNNSTIIFLFMLILLLLLSLVSLLFSRFFITFLALSSVLARMRASV